LDNDCNGSIDDGLSSTSYFLDEDGDGFGDAAFSLDTCLAAPPEGYVANETDCNDADSDINPDAEEVLDSLDNNCNGMIDEGLVVATSIEPAGWEFFPNPVREELILQSGYAGAVTARLYSGEGKMSREARLDMASGRAVLNLQGTAAGFYFLELLDQQGKRLLIEKILKY
ncbi:MAG: hypothetical protein KDD28_25785, partial [Phaeodactylibacter sp.]|nr:hypothetical protein [Phaeodactylibacter sp.]